MVKFLVVGVCALALAACTSEPDRLNWMQVPEDPEVYTFVLQQCLTSSRGPQSTKYNDWDEAIGECGRVAANASRYCPAGRLCDPSVNSRADVRMIIKGKK